MRSLINVQPDSSISVALFAFIHGAVADFAHFLAHNESARALLLLAMQEAEDKCPPSARPLSVNSIAKLLEALDRLLIQAPAWDVSIDEIPLIGCPMNHLFRPIMNTPSGWQFFFRKDVNSRIENLLRSWARFLASEASTYCLSANNGWCSPQAQVILARQADANGRSFTDIFKCPDPSDNGTLGFTSWDAFFTRKYMPGIRPVLGILDTELSAARHRHQLTTSVAHPCEASRVRLHSNLCLSDTFWLKDQRYSLIDALNGHWSTERFCAGSLYQAYLSSLTYHRWHAPVNGTVLSVHHIPGTYFSQLPIRAHLDLFDGPGSGGGIADDPAPPGESQPYLASVATRVLILYEADCPRIGLVAFLAIGMAEVSSCEVEVVEGQHVRIGQEVGTFRYGGSTYCLLFEPGKGLRFEAPLGAGAGNSAVRSLLARVHDADDTDDGWIDPT